MTTRRLSFLPRLVDPILSGEKRSTIRKFNRSWVNWKPDDHLRMTCGSECFATGAVSGIDIQPSDLTDAELEGARRIYGAEVKADVLVRVRFTLHPEYLRADPA